MSWTDWQLHQEPDMPVRTGEVGATSTAAATSPPPQDLAELAERLLLPIEFLREVDWLIKDRKAIIFTGPPGSGKTFLAKALADFYGGSDFYDGGRSIFLQFHQSYAYEDFVEGFRPVTNQNNQLEYKVVRGPLRRIAKVASRDLDASVVNGVPASNAPVYVLVLDEINRANLSKVMGELFYALEYRGESVQLLYSKKKLSLPENLLVLGTMNTADRSIATFDIALRRRFHFVECDPLREPFKVLLRRFFQHEGRSDLYWLSDLVDEANRRIPDPVFAIGPSHFMKKGITEEDAKRIWNHSVWPFLAARFDVESISNLRWEQLRTTDTTADVAEVEVGLDAQTPVSDSSAAEGSSDPETLDLGEDPETRDPGEYN